MNFSSSWYGQQPCQCTDECYNNTETTVGQLLPSHWPTGQQEQTATDMGNRNTKHIHWQQHKAAACNQANGGWKSQPQPLGLPPHPAHFCTGTSKEKRCRAEHTPAAAWRHPSGEGRAALLDLLQLHQSVCSKTHPWSWQYPPYPCQLVDASW